MQLACRSDRLPGSRGEGAGQPSPTPDTPDRARRELTPSGHTRVYALPAAPARARDDP